MLTVTDELKGPGLVFTMLKKCFGEDFDAKGNCSQIAFTKDYRVCLTNERFKSFISIRVLYSIYQVNSTSN
jgi:hypothetical protein